MDATKIHADIEALIKKIPQEETRLIAEGQHILQTIRADMSHLLSLSAIETWTKSVIAKVEGKK